MTIKSIERASIDSERSLRRQVSQVKQALVDVVNERDRLAKLVDLQREENRLLNEENRPLRDELRYYKRVNDKLRYLVMEMKDQTPDERRERIMDCEASADDYRGNVFSVIQALRRIRKTALANGEDCSYLIAREALGDD